MKRIPSYESSRLLFSWSWWWTRKPGMLQSMGSQRVGHNGATELNWGSIDHSHGGRVILVLPGFYWRIIEGWWIRLSDAFVISLLSVDHIRSSSSFQVLGPRSWESSWLVSFSHVFHPVHQQTLLALPSECIQSLTTSPVRHYHTGPCHHRLHLESPLNWSSHSWMCYTLYPTV